MLDIPHDEVRLQNATRLVLQYAPLQRPSRYI